MAWRPADFAEATDENFAYAQAYSPVPVQVDDDLSEVVRAVVRQQEAALAVFTVVSSDPTGVTEGGLTVLDGNIAAMRSSTNKLEQAVKYLRGTLP